MQFGRDNINTPHSNGGQLPDQRTKSWYRTYRSATRSVVADAGRRLGILNILRPSASTYWHSVIYYRIELGRSQLFLHCHIHLSVHRKCVHCIVHHGGQQQRNTTWIEERHGRSKLLRARVRAIRHLTRVAGEKSHHPHFSRGEVDPHPGTQL